MSQSRCVGLVLAGGRSSRMGQDKANLTRKDQSMLEFSCDMLHRCGVDDVIISGQRHGGVNDIIADSGPLGGIWSVISHIECDSLLITPVDMPLMNSDTLNQLKKAGQVTGRASYFNQANLPVFLPVTDALKRFLSDAITSPAFSQSKRTPSLKALFSALNAQSIPLEDEQCLINANTPQQWSLCQTLIS